MWIVDKDVLLKYYIIFTVCKTYKANQVRIQPETANLYFALILGVKSRSIFTLMYKLWQDKVKKKKTKKNKNNNNKKKKQHKTKETLSLIRHNVCERGWISFGI